MESLFPDKPELEYVTSGISGISPQTNPQSSTGSVWNTSGVVSPLLSQENYIIPHIATGRRKLKKTDGLDPRIVRDKDNRPCYISQIRD